METFSEYFKVISVSYPFGVTEITASSNDVQFKNDSMILDVFVEIEGNVIKVYKLIDGAQRRLLIASNNFTFKYVNKM